MNCKLTDTSTQQEDRQTFREGLRPINQARGGNLLATPRLSVLYFALQLHRYCIPHHVFTQSHLQADLRGRHQTTLNKSSRLTDPSCIQICGVLEHKCDGIGGKPT